MKKRPSLLLCLFMDALGYATYALPVIGEFGDILWAPLSAFVFYRTFGGMTGGLINFVEEAVPGLDFIPTFTLAWLLQYRKEKSLNRQRIS